ncbi:MAG: hypothetical protein P8016_03575 [Sedimentisphaerales bacterium]
MENYDSNMIRPVDSLQTITGLTPTRRREQRRRRRQLEHRKQEQQERENNDETRSGIIDESLHIDEAGDTKIDYRA